MHTEFVTVATFQTPVDAHLARSRIEGEGIETILLDENTVHTLWHMNTAFGGIKLQVYEEDGQRAVAILSNNQVGRASQGGLPAVAYDDDTKEEEKTSADKKLDRAYRAAIYGLIAFPIQLFSLWYLGALIFTDKHFSRKHWRGVLITFVLDLPGIAATILVVTLIVRHIIEGFSGTHSAVIDLSP